MTLKLIRLELARTKDHPEGSAAHGYEFTAPLDAEGHLDMSGWKADKLACTVWRFWHGEDDEHGVLIHGPGGWAFSYEPGEEDDEPIFKFDRHNFLAGEYVSITEHDGVTRPFRVAWVKQAPALSKG